MLPVGGRSSLELHRARNGESNVNDDPFIGILCMYDG